MKNKKVKKFQKNKKLEQKNQDLNCQNLKNYQKQININKSKVLNKRQNKLKNLNKKI